MTEKVQGSGCVMLAGIFHVDHLSQALKDKYAVVPINASFSSQEKLTEYGISVPEGTTRLTDSRQQGSQVEQLATQAKSEGLVVSRVKAIQAAEEEAKKAAGRTETKLPMPELNKS